MMVVTGKRARLHGPLDLRFEPIELDLAALAPTEIYAETEYSAVSVGTEKAAYVGSPPLRAGPIYPRLVGYCNAAKVVAVGSDVTGLVAGDRVLTHQSHQSCFVTGAADVLARMDANLSSRTGSIAYIAHLGLNALLRAGFRAGENVVVQGLGPIGLATVSVARAMGAKAVVAIGNSDTRLRKAMELGATSAIDAHAGDLTAQLTAANKGVLSDIVITTVNSWSAWPTTLQAVREFGRIVVLGFPGRGEPPPTSNPFDPPYFYTRQVTVISAGLAAGPGPWGDGDRATHLRHNMQRILDLAGRGKLPLDALITDEVAWSELGTIYERAERGDKAMICPVLRWRAP